MFAIAPIVSIACIFIGYRDALARMGSERAIIVWDAATQTEHFIRTAKISTNRADLGFVVPTPSKPTLTEVSSEAFKVLDERLAIIDRKEMELERLSGLAGGPVSAAKAGEPVSSTSVYVAGYDATILRSNDAGALSKWLSRHGYPMTTQFQKWLAPYSKSGWYITIFKVSAKGQEASLGTVRISFRTKQPIYPYREPEGYKILHRTLAVIVVADAPMETEETCKRITQMTRRATITGKEFVKWAPLLVDRASTQDALLLAKALKLPSKLFLNRTTSVFKDKTPERVDGRDFAFVPNRTVRGRFSD